MTRILTALAVLALLAGACSAPPQGDDAQDDQDDGGVAEGEEPGGTASPTAGDEPDDGEGAAGGTLVVGRTGDIDNLDPHLATAFQTYQALELVYDTLFELDPDLNVEGGLAEDWEFSEDGTTLRIGLREGVTFHDGDEFDAEDVRASLERILDEDTGAVARANLVAITGIEAPDAGTVELTLSEPDATLPAALADANTAIMSAAAIEADTVGTEPSGTGPFTFADWTQGEVFSVTANPDYWGGEPALDGVDIRVIPDESSVLAGLRAGEFHMGILTDPTVITQAGEELVVERTPALAYHALMMNAERPPLDDERVRQAISCAIDREELIASAVLDEGEVTGPFTIPAYESDPYDGLPCDPRDLDTARELLADAGHGDGFALQTIVMTGGYATAVNEAQSLQSQLSEIGVTLELEQLETNVYVDRWLEADFDAAVALNGGRPDPHHMYVRYFTSDGNLNHVATYSSEELDQLFADGKATTDPADRQGIYDDISSTLLEASPWVWLFNGYEYRVLQPEVSGFVPMPTGSLKALRQTSLEG